MAIFESPYALGERVYVGPGRDLTAVVIGVLWSKTDPDIKVTYVHNGNVYSTWADLSIVSKIEADSTPSSTADSTRTTADSTLVTADAHGGS